MTQDLIDLTMEGATLVRHGYFTLAVDKAQEKLKKFQLPDPRYYLAQMVQALLASGALSLDVEVQDQEVTIRFDGPGYTPEELGQITDAVFESGKDRSRDRLRELALGLLSVQGLNPRELSISSNGWCWSKAGGLRPAPPGAQEIRIRHHRKDTREEQILRQVCQSCQADIRLNGAVVCTRGGRPTSCPWPNFSFRGPGFRGAFGIAYGQLEKSSLVLTRYGVVYSKRHEPRIQPALLVEMENDSLRKNASQSDVVEDESYSRMLADLQGIQLRFAIQLAGQRIPAYQAEQVYAYLRQVAVQNLSADLLRLPSDELGELERQLLQAPLFRGAGGQRYSAAQLWEYRERDGGLLYSSERRPNFNWEEAPVLDLNAAGLSAMQSLFGRLLETSPKPELCRSKLSELRNLQAQELPPVLLSQALTVSGTDMQIVLLDTPPAPEVGFYWQETPGRVSHRRALCACPLSYALTSRQSLKLSAENGARVAERYAEPAYVALAERMREPAFPGTRRRYGGLERLGHFLEWKFGSVARGLEDPVWSGLGFLSTFSARAVSCQDLAAWLEVYPAVVVAFAKVAGEDHALQVTPAILRGLRERFGAERIVLADLTAPRLVERGQQAGLSGAAVAGVQRAEVVDEDEELAALRREIEAERRSPGLQARPEAELDEARVLSQLGLSGKGADAAAELPAGADFAALCLAATKRLHTRWLTRFELLRVSGQLVVHDGALPAPLEANRLLVKIADNEPVAYDIGFLGVTGWVHVPPDWSLPDYAEIGQIRADSRPGQPGESWPEPELPFSLSVPEVQREFVWALRRLFKFAAQQAARDAEPAHMALWGRRLIRFVLWDRNWALHSPESWFWRVPLLTSLAGNSVTLQDLRDMPDPISAVGLEPGRAAQPHSTFRVLPPWSVESLQQLLGRTLQAAQLVEEEKREDQLLVELRQKLVATCQRAQCPLEPAWLDGLRFGPPTRWFGGPRKYFIEHAPETATTRLNPADRLLRALFQNGNAWHQRVPVLASAIYTAINRALDEVDDDHELAYLKAMLERLG